MKIKNIRWYDCDDPDWEYLQIGRCQVDLGKYFSREEAYIIDDKNQNLVITFDGGECNLYNCNDDGSLKKMSEQNHIHICWSREMFKTLNALVEHEIDFSKMKFIEG